jgi:hypothetical protein
MNQKIAFLTDNKVEPEDIILTAQSEYSIIAKNLDEHYKLRGSLSAFWHKSLESPEFYLMKSDETCKITTKSDNFVIATIDNEQIAENIIILLNLAFREGAKKVMHILERL